MALTALIALAIALGAALFLYTFFHDTTGKAVRTWILIRRFVGGLFILLFGLVLLSTGVTAFIALGALVFFIGFLYALYDDSFAWLRGLVPGVSA